MFLDHQICETKRHERTWFEIGFHNVETRVALVAVLKYFRLRIKSGRVERSQRHREILELTQDAFLWS